MADGVAVVPPVGACSAFTGSGAAGGTTGGGDGTVARLAAALVFWMTGGAAVIGAAVARAANIASPVSLPIAGALISANQINAVANNAATNRSAFKPNTLTRP